MTLVTSNFLLKKAQKGKYAIGAFNVYNIETIQGVLRAAESLNAPVIIQTSESAIKYAGIKTLAEIIISQAKNSKIPVSLHLDHGRSFSIIKQCLKLGYTSVMYDGSLLPFNKNIFQTKKVVNLANKYGASVEAELGILSGKEDEIQASKDLYTNPEKAVEFYNKTKIDSLAISIGTSHGAVKKRAHNLDFARLKEINSKVNIPLVLHGASLIEPSQVKKANKAGIKIKNAQGVNPQDIKKAIKLGITKINTDTDLRIAFSTALRSYSIINPNSINPRDILSNALSAVENNVKRHIILFGSKNKA